MFAFVCCLLTWRIIPTWLKSISRSISQNSDFVIHLKQIFLDHFATSLQIVPALTCQIPRRGDVGQWLSAKSKEEKKWSNIVIGQEDSPVCFATSNYIIEHRSFLRWRVVLWTVLTHTGSAWLSLHSLVSQLKMLSLRTWTRSVTPAFFRACPVVTGFVGSIASGALQMPLVRKLPLVSP